MNSPISSSTLNLSTSDLTPSNSSSSSSSINSLDYKTYRLIEDHIKSPEERAWYLDLISQYPTINASYLNGKESQKESQKEMENARAKIAAFINRNK